MVEHTYKQPPTKGFAADKIMTPFSRKIGANIITDSTFQDWVSGSESLRYWAFQAGAVTKATKDAQYCALWDTAMSIGYGATTAIAAGTVSYDFYDESANSYAIVVLAMPNLESQPYGYYITGEHAGTWEVLSGPEVPLDMMHVVTSTGSASKQSGTLNVVAAPPEGNYIYLAVINVSTTTLYLTKLDFLVGGSSTASNPNLSDWAATPTPIQGNVYELTDYDTFLYGDDEYDENSEVYPYATGSSLGYYALRLKNSDNNSSPLRLIIGQLNENLELTYEYISRVTVYNIEHSLDAAAGFVMFNGNPTVSGDATLVRNFTDDTWDSWTDGQTLTADNWSYYAYVPSNSTKYTAEYRLSKNVEPPSNRKIWVGFAVYDPRATLVFEKLELGQYFSAKLIELHSDAKTTDVLESEPLFEVSGGADSSILKLYSDKTLNVVGTNFNLDPLKNIEIIEAELDVSETFAAYDFNSVPCSVTIFSSNSSYPTDLKFNYNASGSIDADYGTIYVNTDTYTPPENGLAVALNGDVLTLTNGSVARKVTIVIYKQSI